MARQPRLERQLAELLATLAAAGARFALIGGLALAPHKVIRATQDIDLLADAAGTEAIHQALLALGYQCMHRSDDAGNYQRGDERVDFIYAHRPAALRLLQRALPLETEFGQLHVVSAEGLIGLKLQAYANNPRRTLDVEDIRALLAANRATLDMDEVRGYFRLRQGNPAGGTAAMKPALPQQPTPFTGEGGLPPPPAGSAGDPLRELFDLMVVVEALSPTWPERPTFAGATRFLL